MRWSPFLHSITWVSAILGFLAFMASLIATTGDLMGLSDDQLFNITKSLLLISISFALGTIIHQNNEESER
ncbi:MAG: hypothetical protein WDZ69_00875 [Candidatus Pacearchaeota archaeon]